MIKPETVKELVDCLEWYVENDDTNNYPNNEFWIDGLERARKALEIYNSEVITDKHT